jgi:hypothetical protein
MQHSILSRHYQDYLEIIKNNGLLSPHNFKNIPMNEFLLVLLELQNNKDRYKLTEFDIYKYLTAYNYILNSLNCNKYKLTEGAGKPKYKYNNILIDLFYHNIPSDIINYFPISLVFSIKQEGNLITDLTKKEIQTWEGNIYWDPYSLDHDNVNFYKEIHTYRSKHSNYAGNSYTYYIFKQLTKSLLTEVYLYKFKGKLYTHKELIIRFHLGIMNHPDPIRIRTITEMVESGDIQKIKYHCIKVMDPISVTYLTLSELKIYLIDVNKIGNFEASYESLIEKSFGSLWDYDSALINNNFMKTLKYKKVN